MSSNGLSLVELFARLQAPEESGGDSNRFTAIPISSFGTYRLGKDSAGAPALLIQMPPDQPTHASPIRLRHLYVAHDVDCVVHRDQSTESGKFSVLSCVESDRATENYFLRVVEALLPSLGERPDGSSINEAVESLVELFRALGNPPIKAVRGLWAELLLITECQDPGKLLDAWHTVPEDWYDFNEGNHRIEVKSAQGEVRRHHFSLVQLLPPSGTSLAIVSVIVNRAGGGTTINDLIDELRSFFSGSPDRLLRLYKVVTLTLGAKWREAELEMFDRSAARESLAFFRPADVPMVNPDLPTGVSNVRFSSDLTGKVPYSVPELRALGGLIGSAVPRTESC